MTLCTQLTALVTGSAEGYAASENMYSVSCQILVIIKSDPDEKQLSDSLVA